jgi:glycosyltransferase involved in cell wall biosynthesis
MNEISTESVAILLASYNGGKFIAEQLESLYNQSYEDFCCYIHDDGSDDGTVEIIKLYCKRYPDKFIFLGSDKTGGAASNFFMLMETVEAAYYLFCDQDDVWDPDKIQLVSNRMKEIEKNHPGQEILVHTDVCVVDEKLKTVADSYYSLLHQDPSFSKPLQIIASNTAIGATVMFNRKLRETALKALTSKKPMLHDWLLALICSMTGIISYIDIPTMKYRQHGNNEVGAHERENTFQKVWHRCFVTPETPWDFPFPLIFMNNHLTLLGRIHR